MRSQPCVESPIPPEFQPFSAHLAGRCRKTVLCSLSDDSTRRWINSEPFRIIGIFVSSQPAINRLPQQSGQFVLDIPSHPRFIYHIFKFSGQTKSLIQLTIDQYPASLLIVVPWNSSFNFPSNLTRKARFPLSPIGFPWFFHRKPWNRPIWSLHHTIIGGIISF